MKRILFTLDHMNVGGVEKAFLGMLNAMPKDDLEIHVAFFVPEGGFLQYLPDYVHVHTIEPYYSNIDFLYHPVRTTLRDVLHGRFKAIPRFGAFLLSKLAGDKVAINRYLLRGDDALGMEFDVAVNYASPHEYLDYYVGHHVRATSRATWIHFDVSRCYNSVKSIRQAMHHIDRIFVVSDRARRIFCEKFPELAARTRTFHNIISPEMILNDSTKPCDMRPEKDVLNIVTVGRISIEKGQRDAIAAVARLNATGHRAILHLVGNGTDATACRRFAMDCGIDDCIKFYGAKANPYPYMARADIYLQPSRHEGYCITLAEAKLFDAPIVATDFTGAREQLSQRSNAVIAEDFTPEGLANAILRAAELPRAHSIPDGTYPDEMIEFLKLLTD